MAKELNGRNSFPKTYNKYNYRLQTSPSDWWCSGFYPGTLFYLYEETGQPELYKEGTRMLSLLKKEQYNVDTHDIGFMMYCSYGNANRLKPDPTYKEILINSAKSLTTRFNPTVGCIRSHNRKETDYVVIIDNMMNLELLFWATQMTGDSTYWDIAVKHANTTLKNHFRKECLQRAEKILSVLSSPRYTAPTGTYGGFILMHSVGNIPSATELDVPLSYADYYYVEALKRYKTLLNKQTTSLKNH